ncbi:hypothetical protein KAR91_24410 [Candidatus Pacearchaeota archaeon]|nr:hypothetical protein [Candidatus Pacearchaeota archaeon]
MTEQNELVVIETASIPALFQKDGSDPIIEGLKKEAEKFKGDVTTVKGRKEIASFARKFSTSKTYLGKLGKALSDELREKIAPIQAERNKIETCCDELRDKIRKPLTDWEDAEKKRVADIEARIAFIGEAIDCEFAGSYDADIALKRIRAIVIDESFEEFELAATKAKESTLKQLEANFIVLQNAEKEKAEADRLEKEKLEKEQKEREDRIAREAAEQATKDAEDVAAAEAEEKDRLAKEAIEKAERETLEAKEATEKAEREKNEAAEKAEREKQEAIDAETKRIEDEAEVKRLEDEKLAKNRTHRGKLNKAAKASFVSEGFDEAVSETLVKLIAKGKIANITINY